MTVIFLEYSKKRNPLFFFFLFLFFQLAVALTRDIDLGVIIGAFSGPTFLTMKNTINQMIDHYGTTNARYSLITIGSDAKTEIAFSDDYNNTQGFKNRVSETKRPLGSPDLKRALDAARRGFAEAASSRPGAKKILIVMIDQKSVNYPQVLSASAKRFEEAGILVVPVAVGSLANVDELTRIVPSKGVVIKVSSNDDPAVIAQKIMGGAVNGGCFRCFLLLFFFFTFCFSSWCFLSLFY